MVEPGTGFYLRSSRMKYKNYWIAILSLLLILNFGYASKDKKLPGRNQSVFHAMTEVQPGGTLYIEDGQYDISVKGAPPRL